MTLGTITLFAMGAVCAAAAFIVILVVMGGK